MGRRGRPPYPDVLTPREWEVLELLRQGLSNPEIADRLGISRDGAKYHVSEILTKLGLSSRAEAASWSPSPPARPWWAAVAAPLAFLGRRSAMAIAAGLFVAAVAGLGLLAFLLLRGGGGDAETSILISGGDTPASRHELAYFSQDGSLWLYNADTDGAVGRVLAQNATCGRFSRLEWSPTGDRIACVSTQTVAGTPAGRLVLRDATGRVIADRTIEGLRALYWSPTGKVFLYETQDPIADKAPQPGPPRFVVASNLGQDIADLGQWDLPILPGQAWYQFPLWSPQGDEIAYRPATDTVEHIYSLVSGERTTRESRYPLAFAMNGQAEILAQNYQETASPGELVRTYEAVLYASHNGNGQRLPVLDNGNQFWLSPDFVHVVYLTRDQRADGLPGLGVLDLNSGEAKPIPDSIITYGSDHIPPEWVTFSRDGKWVYWVGGDNNGYRARIDGSGLEKIVSLDTLAFDWSPDHRMLSYVDFTTDGVNDTNTLYVVLPDGTKRVIDERSTSGGGFTTVPLGYAWRPGTELQ